MGRPIGSKDKKSRAKARTAFETYNYWYDKYTKGIKAGWFADRYTEAEFNKQYELAKLAKLKNPARMVAASQEFVDRSFEKKYKQLYGKDLGNIKNKNTRVKIFEDFVDDMQTQGMTYDQARAEFEQYFY
jgi:hypothetical protein